MSWKQMGISICRRAFTGQLFKNSNPKSNVTFGSKSEIKTRQRSSDCCSSKFKSIMDEATVPEGSWSENYKRMDEKRTKILVLGVVTFLITMGVVQVKGLVKGHPEISLIY